MERLARSVTVEDPEFDDDDRNLVYAWQAEEAVKCQGCGLPLDETTSKEALSDRGAYWVDEIECAACATKGATAKELSADDQDTGPGKYWIVKRRGEPEHGG